MKSKLNAINHFKGKKDNDDEKNDVVTNDNDKLITKTTKATEQ